MEVLRNLLVWNISARDPFVMSFLIGAIIGLTFIFATRPHLYLPMMLLTAPLPKFFTINRYESAANAVGAQSAAGFSVVDMVLAAGMVALLFRGWKRPRLAEASVFNRALLLWSCTIAFSVAVGLFFWRGLYSAGNSLYALRYILTLVSYGLAVQYAMSESADGCVRNLRRLALAGNITIALGVLYYFLLGSSGGGTVGATLFDADATVYRSFLFFFDYGNDMGFYAATIAVLNFILLTDRNIIGLRIIGAIGIVLCVISVLVLGERANLLLLVVALGYFLFETSMPRHSSVRVSAVFRIACVLTLLVAAIVVIRYVAPQTISQKLQSVEGVDYQSDANEIMSTAGVPQVVIGFVASLPIGDLAVRLGLSIASLWFFFQHPGGVGFWGELDVVGWWAHHEFVKTAVEQGIPGLLAFLWLILTLKRLLWSRGDLRGTGGQLGVLLRSISVGLFAIMLMANTVLLDMKYAFVYWTLLGIWSALPRVRKPQLIQVLVRQRETADV